MNFKPFSNKYDFKKSALIKDFPSYFINPIENWLLKILGRVNKLDTTGDYVGSGRRYVKSQFLNNLQIIFREEFPQYWNEFYVFIYSDTDRFCNFLAFVLQNYVDWSSAQELEYILAQGGSAYKVIKTNKSASEYEVGIYDLVDRVTPIVVENAKIAISENEVLMNAWLHCYGRNPDYEKVVIECQNFLELFLRDSYEPGNKKPQLGKLIGNLKVGNKLSFKGDSVLTDKTDLLKLIDNVQNFRGMHTAGTGKKPAKEDAEFVLHTTIFIWNLHQK